MKTAFKTLLVLPFMVCILSSCSNYGKKITVAGTKGEIYYKGDGITEADAQKLGVFLKELPYFDSTVKTVQLLKAKDGGYDVRFVVDEKKMKETAGIENSFVAIGALVSKNVFGSNPVNIILADEFMKDLKSLPYDKQKAEALLAADDKTTDTPTNSMAGYDKQIADGITFYWKDPITDNEAETIGKAIINTGDFKGGTPETTNIIMQKNGDTYVVKYIVSDAYINDAATLTTMEGIGQKIKKAAFANVPFSFVMVDEKMNDAKRWDY